MFNKIKKWFRFGQDSEQNDESDELTQMSEKIKDMPDDDLKYINKLIDLYINNPVMLRLLADDENYLVMTSVNNEKENIRYFSSNVQNVKFLTNAKEIIREDVMQALGPIYDQRLEEFEPETAMAFKEADYQIARAEALEAELQYYKAVNDPNGMHSIQLLNLWNHVQEKKKALDVFEQQIG